MKDDQLYPFFEAAVQDCDPADEFVNLRYRVELSPEAVAGLDAIFNDTERSSRIAKVVEREMENIYEEAFQKWVSLHLRAGMGLHP